MTAADVLLSRLPEEARKALRRALDAGPEARSHDADVTRALAAVAFPMPELPGWAVYELASSLTEAQRALAELACIHGLNTFPYGLPGSTSARKRWLGLEPPGVLESTLVDGAPLWQALQRAKKPLAQARILDQLAIAVGLAALGEIAMRPFEYRIQGDAVMGHGDVGLLKRLRKEGRAWAVGFADRIPADNGPHRNAACVPLFLALVRAGVPIEERWERLFPNLFGVGDAVLVECARGLPPARREAVLVAEVARSMSRTAVVRLLAEFPYTAVARALLAKTEVNSKSWQWLVKELTRVGKKQPAIRAALDEALGKAPKPVGLAVAASRKPRDAGELTALERDQLRIAGKRYDGANLPAEERLSKAPRDEEKCFRGSLELRTLAGAAGEPLYDALLYMGDAGTIFRAGTKQVVAEVIQFGVQLTKPDPALRTALQLAIDTRSASKMPARAKPGGKKRR